MDTERLPDGADRTGAGCTRLGTDGASTLRVERPRWLDGVGASRFGAISVLGLGDGMVRKLRLGIDSGDSNVRVDGGAVTGVRVGAGIVRVERVLSVEIRLSERVDGVITRVDGVEMDGAGDGVRTVDGDAVRGVTTVRDVAVVFGGPDML